MEVECVGNVSIPVSGAGRRRSDKHVRGTAGEVLAQVALDRLFRPVLAGMVVIPARDIAGAKQQQPDGQDGADRSEGVTGPGAAVVLEVDYRQLVPDVGAGCQLQNNERPIVED